MKRNGNARSDTRVKFVWASPDLTSCTHMLQKKKKKKKDDATPSFFAYFFFMLFASHRSKNCPIDTWQYWLYGYLIGHVHSLQFDSVDYAYYKWASENLQSRLVAISFLEISECPINGLTVLYQSTESVRSVS